MTGQSTLQTSQAPPADPFRPVDSEGNLCWDILVSGLGVDLDSSWYHFVPLGSQLGAVFVLSGRASLDQSCPELHVTKAIKRINIWPYIYIVGKYMFIYDID